MSPNEINSLPSHLQDLVNREVERRLEQAQPQQEEQLPLGRLPIPHPIGDAPREMPLSVWLYLRLCSNSVGSSVGWTFAGVGFLFVLIAVAAMGLDDVIPRNWVDAGKGTITNIEQTNTTINDNRVFAYHFEATDDEGEKISGISYEYSGKYEIGDEVSLEKAEERYRIQGLTLTSTGALFVLLFGGIGMLFGVIGLCVLTYIWFAGGKKIHFLRDGTAIGARFFNREPTIYRVGGGSGRVGGRRGRVSSRHGINEGQPVMKVNFEYQVDGERHTASAYALDTSRLTDTKYTTVLYDPMQPEKSVVLDGLPSGVHIEDLTGYFWVNPMRLVLPLLAATTVCGQIVAIVVFVLRAI